MPAKSAAPPAPPSPRGRREPPPEYAPHRPEETVLYGVVSAQLESFFERQRRRERHVPRFVERELRAFLDCGILANGFLRVHCDACGKDRLVAFSCKGRAFCPSCGGRRMADTAAHLVDRVFPQVPVRQWVLSLPFALRYRLAYDAALVSSILQLFVRAVFASTCRRAPERGGDGRARCGAVTFIQRFGGAVNLNVHLHTLAPDGVYITRDSGEVRFLPVPPPDDAEVARVTMQVARRIAKLVERRGLGKETDPEEADPLDYQLKLYYNSKIWEHLCPTYLPVGDVCEGQLTQPSRWAYGPKNQPPPIGSPVDDRRGERWRAGRFTTPVHERVDARPTVAVSAERASACIAAETLTVVEDCAWEKRTGATPRVGGRTSASRRVAPDSGPARRASRVRIQGR